MVVIVVVVAVVVMVVVIIVAVVVSRAVLVTGVSASVVAIEMSVALEFTSSKVSQYLAYISQNTLVIIINILMDTHVYNAKC